MLAVGDIDERDLLLFSYGHRRQANATQATTDRWLHCRWRIFQLDSAGMSRQRLEGVKCSEETDMEATAAAIFVAYGSRQHNLAIFIAMFLPLILSFLLPLILSGKQWRAAQDRARARRIADARMNARLLRLNL
jgi:hypothetical protein